jgi:hypothetical protein
VRRGKVKVFCKNCSSWFQINFGKKKPTESLLLAHLSGVSFRSLGDTYGIDPSTAYRRCLRILNNLPHCADITRNYCNKFCGILLVDGKYIRIKGYDRKLPVLYGIDYLTHDIPTYILSTSENYHTCKSFFTSLRLLNYPLQAVVSDDNINIYQAATAIYPNSVSQICTNHYKESIRGNLSVRTDPTYTLFMKRIEELFIVKRSEGEFRSLAGKILHRYKDDPRCVGVLIDIQKRLPQLTAYMSKPHIPMTTNLIESYNSHLEGRLKTIKGFESFKHANTWLNAYFMRRRLKKFTDCTKQFSYLNGTNSLKQTLRDGVEINEISKFFR